MIGESFQPKIANHLGNEGIDITYRHVHVFASTQQEISRNFKELPQN